MTQAKSIVNISLEEELKKNGELKKSDIDHLKEWCKSQPHLPEISDSELIIFLHSNHYCIEPTKKTIDAYYTYKTEFTEFFADRDPLGNKNIRQTFSVLANIPLKQLTKEGYHIIFSQLIDSNPSNCVFIDCAKLIFMVLELWMYNAGTINGHVIIFNVYNFSMGHVTRVNLLKLKNFFFFLQEAMPVRLKALHFINCTSAIHFLFRMVKPFLKKEMADMFNFHLSLETLEEYLPIEALPNELCGQAGPLMELHEAEIKKLEAHRDWFLDEQFRARVDESKRPKK